MMKMALQEAASAAKKFCILRDEEREAYPCAETAKALGARAAGERLRAYWRHFKTHVEAYVRWAVRQHLYDPTVHYTDPREGVIDLVEQALISFQPVVQEGRYDSEKGLPCKYIKRSIKNRFQDILRRGRHPTKEECERCWQERGGCRFSEIGPPGAEERQRCLLPPAVDRLEIDEALFATAGLHEEWPPTPWSGGNGALPHRPVETQALEQILTGAIGELIMEKLTPDQRYVLIEFILRGRSGYEVAESLKTSRSNVYQLKRRGIKQLSQLLEAEA